MRTIGAFVCLFLLTPIGGWWSTSGSTSETKFLAEIQTPARAALTFALRQGTAARQRGDPASAADIFRQGYREAARQKEPRLQAHFLWGIANCHATQHRYREALDEYLAVREALALFGPPKSLSAVIGSISSLYAQLGEYEAAIETVSRALEKSPVQDSNGRRARLLVLQATLLAQNGKADEAQHTFG